MEENKKTEENIGETNRQSGLAYAAGLVFFTSVVTLLGAGYLLDLWLKSSPWGLVGGIVLGSVVGLYQFVKITNRINN